MPIPLLHRPPAARASLHSLRVASAVAVLMLNAMGARGQEPDSLAALPVEIGGVVTELSTNDPVVDATVRLRPGTDPSDARTAPSNARTDEQGRFLLVPVPPGSYTLVVERIGYQPLEYAVELSPGTETNLQIRLVPEAVRLEPVVVVGTRRSRLSLSGFDERRRAGIGTFITRTEIDGQEVLFATDLLRSVPGVQLLPLPESGRLDVRMRGGCRPLIVVNGVRRELLPGETMDDLVLTDFIDGIEIYRDFIPVQFGESDCGAVVIWTRNTVPGRESSPMWKKIIIGLFAIAGLVFLAT